MKQLYDIILASGSPRRRELLTQAGLSFVVKTADVDETPTETEPAKIVEELSRRKAEAVMEMFQTTRMESACIEKQDVTDAVEYKGVHDAIDSNDKTEQSSLDIDQIIVAADTIVAMDGDVLGIPKDAEDAVRMLKELSGRTHEVYTGVTIFPVDPETQQSYTFSSCTKVTFYPLSEAEIRDYVASGEPMDKAGAYGIQGLGERLVERIEGDYNNVVGFPLSAFMRILAQKGMISYD